MNEQARTRPPGRAKGAPSLGSRIKSTVKSWLRRLGMPRKSR